MRFTVYGKAATKGSTKSFVKRGRVVTLPDNKNLGAWTQAAKWAAREAGASITLRPRAVRVLITFHYLLPASVKHREHHTVKPDIDKLIRAVLDALTGIAYEDDAQVMTVFASKMYGPEEFCVIEVNEVG